jgi:hypothetical protein
MIGIRMSRNGRARSPDCSAVPGGVVIGDFDGPPPAPEPREQLLDGIERYRRRVLCRPRLGQIPGFG